MVNFGSSRPPARARIRPATKPTSRPLAPPVRVTSWSIAAAAACSPGRTAPVATGPPGCPGTAAPSPARRSGRRSTAGARGRSRRSRASRMRRGSRSRAAVTAGESPPRRIPVRELGRTQVGDETAGLRVVADRPGDLPEGQVHLGGDVVRQRAGDLEDEWGHAVVALVGGAGEPGEHPEREDGAGDDDARVGHDGREGVGQGVAEGPRSECGAAEHVLLVARGGEGRGGAADGGLGDLVELGPEGLRVPDGAGEVAAGYAGEPGQLRGDRSHRLAGERRQDALLAQVEEDPAGARVDRLEQPGQDPASERVAQGPVEPDPEAFAGSADVGVALRFESRAEDAGAAGHHAPDRVAAERGDRREHSLHRAEGQVDRIGGRTVGDGEERGDRPGLEQRDLAAGDRPLDVLRRAVLRLDPPTEVDQRAHIVVGKGGLGSAVAVAGLDTAAGERRRRDGLGAEGSGEEPAGGRVRDEVVRFRPGPRRRPRPARTSRRWPSARGAP